MIVLKEFPGKEFATKEEAFAALRANKEILIEAKKAEIYTATEKGLSVFANQTKIKKSLETSKAFAFDDNYYYFVVNSSRILDSHKDVHIDGNWEKTVKEQQGKVYLVFDHTLKRSEIIAMKQDIEMFTATIPFSLLGKSYEGDTYALIYKVAKDRIVNAEAKEWLEKGYDLEASVRMQYMDIALAMNSNDPDDAKELENYEKYINVIANKDEFEDIYYFWAVLQAKNVLESSLVMFGSNHATGQIQENKNSEAVEDTKEKNGPSNDTHGEPKKGFNLFVKV